MTMKLVGKFTKTVLRGTRKDIKAARQERLAAERELLKRLLRPGAIRMNIPQEILAKATLSFSIARQDQTASSTDSGKEGTPCPTQPK